MRASWKKAAETAWIITATEATAAALSTFTAGDEILLPASVYGGTYRFVDRVLPGRGVTGRYVDHLDEIPSEYRDISEGDPLTAVCDYIAGMTDRYARSRFKSLFVPSSIHY